ncbi:MAG: helix-turn-helix domain-containing protein [Actinomycetota bacterium]
MKQHESTTSPAQSDSKRLLNVPELAERLGIPVQSVYPLVAQGKIPSVRIGCRIRFRESDLDEWLSHSSTRAGLY